MATITYECDRCKGRFRENSDEINGSKCPLCKKGTIVPVDTNDEIEYRHGYPVYKRR